MPVLRASEYVRGMRGGAQAQLLGASDGNYYVVKFSNNPQHRRVLANEMLASRLARVLGLPVPDVALIQVSAEFIAANPALSLRIAGRVVPCEPGLHFASRLPTPRPASPIFDFLPESALDGISNIADFHGMLVLDKWTCNCNGRQVIFCQPAVHRPLRAFMIDQGFCFNAGDWNFPDSPLRGVYTRFSVYNAVRGWERFEPWLTRLQELDGSVLYQIGEEIPPSWYGDPDDLSALLEQLLRRRRLVRELILAVKQSARAPFQNWS